jgi:hypothetical protein
MRTLATRIVAQDLVRVQVKGLDRMGFQFINSDNPLAMCGLSAKIFEPSVSRIITNSGVAA